MFRRRLALLVTIAALIAPWVAPCLAVAPGGHAAMACCHEGDTSTPAVRPCCALDGGQPAVPASAATAILHAAVPVASLWAVLPIASGAPVHVQSKSLVTTEPRVLFSVLLI